MRILSNVFVGEEKDESNGNNKSLGMTTKKLPDDH